MVEKNIKATRHGKVVSKFLKAEEVYAESSFEFLNATLESYKIMLTRIAWWNLQLDEKNRKYASEELAKEIENLEEVIRFIKPHTGSGNLIANSIFNAATTALTYARVIEHMCQTGNFQSQGWDDKKKMFDDCRAKFDGHVKAIINAYKEGTNGKVVDDVLDKMMKWYVNPYNDIAGDSQKGSYAR
jgi:hypothetical protein